MANAADSFSHAAENGQRAMRKLLRDKRKNCPDCGGKGGRHYEEVSSVNHMNTRRSWLPCQTCNLAACGIDERESS